MCWGGEGVASKRGQEEEPREVRGKKTLIQTSSIKALNKQSRTSHSRPHILTLSLTLTLTLTPTSLHPSLCAHLRAVELATGNVGGFVIGREATKSLGCSVNELVVVNPAGADKHHAWARVVCLDVLDKVVPCDGPAAHTKKKKHGRTHHACQHTTVQCSAVRGGNGNSTGSAHSMLPTLCQLGSGTRT